MSEAPGWGFPDKRVSTGGYRWYSCTEFLRDFIQSSNDSVIPIRFPTIRAIPMQPPEFDMAPNRSSQLRKTLVLRNQNSRDNSYEAIKDNYNSATQPVRLGTAADHIITHQSSCTNRPVIPFGPPWSAGRRTHCDIESTLPSSAAYGSIPTTVGAAIPGSTVPSILSMSQAAAAFFFQLLCSLCVGSLLENCTICALPRWISKIRMSICSVGTDRQFEQEHGRERSVAAVHRVIGTANLSRSTAESAQSPPYTV